MAHDRVWIFDLDDTLHNASAHIFPHINRAMTQYLMAHLKLNENDANRMRGEYWVKYGATLNGLMRHHGVDPHHFLHHTHQFPQMSQMVVKSRGLRSALKRLPGEKIVYTNAPMVYAEQVLRLLNIRDLFKGVFSIESSRFQPKPAVNGFMRMLKRMNLQARRCIMVEDSLPALKTAKRLGMKTVYINPRSKRPSYVDVRLASVLGLAVIKNL
ncbi:MAG TPA: pyrimidine 5'-nucleotidase [Methylophilaceae bacterium]